jgi:hypothetical protein
LQIIKQNNWKLGLVNGASFTIACLPKILQSAIDASIANAPALSMKAK